MKYFITKDKYKGDVICLDYKINGYKVNPKKYLPYDGISVNSIIIVKKELIVKVIKRKIKRQLDKYLNLIINDEDGTRESLDDLARYRLLINNKYAKFLDEKYMNLLNKKIDVLDREFKSRLIYQNEINPKSR
ncbi:MAG: hypothetical protein RSB71_03525 [Bacilli bacterium]